MEVILSNWLLAMRSLVGVGTVSSRCALEKSARARRRIKSLLSARAPKRGCSLRRSSARVAEGNLDLGMPCSGDVDPQVEARSDPNRPHAAFVLSRFSHRDSVCGHGCCAEHTSGSSCVHFSSTSHPKQAEEPRKTPKSFVFRIIRIDLSFGLFQGAADYVKGWFGTKVSLVQIQSPRLFLSRLGRPHLRMCRDMAGRCGLRPLPIPHQLSDVPQARDADVP